LIPILDQFEVANPGLTLEVRPTAMLPTDPVPDFTRDEADLHIRFVVGPIEFDRERVRWEQIASPEFLAVAVPAVAENHRDLVERGGFRRARLNHIKSHDGWRVWLTGRGLTDLDKLDGPIFWHTQLAIDATLRGEGISLLDRFLVGDALASGELVDVAPLPKGRAPVLGTYYLVGSAKRWNSQSIARFRSWLLRSAKLTVR
jgi:LysR family glycine cleavage system transcriptional activator